MTWTSDCNLMLNFSFTVSIMSFINASMSDAFASPKFIIKFACFSETWAPPIFLPFKPDSSINFAAK